MAIDGVKIIDSDDGHDIYNYVVEQFKDGVSADKIIATVRAEEDNYCTNDFYGEIYWTALAYALWKIGHLPADIKEHALAIIEKGADAFWLEIDAKALKQRQKALDQLAVQLQSDNPKPIKVPKPKPKRAPYFNQGDVLAVKFDNQYGAVFVSQVDQSPRKIEYHLACTRLLQKNKPTMDDFINSQMAFGKYNTAYALDTDCWFSHKDLGLLLENLEKIGRVELEEYKLWSLSPASTLEDIYDEITRNPRTWQLRIKETYYLIRNYEAVDCVSYHG